MIVPFLFFDLSLLADKSKFVIILFQYMTILIHALERYTRRNWPKWLYNYAIISILYSHRIRLGILVLTINHYK